MRLLPLLYGASANKVLLPAHGEVGRHRGHVAFYCRPCLRWCDVVAVDVDTAKSMHATNAHKGD